MGLRVDDRRRWAVCTAAVFVAQWAWEVIHGRAYLETTGAVVWRITHCLPMAAIDTLWSVVLILVVRCVTAQRPGVTSYVMVAGAGAMTAVLVEVRALHEGRWTNSPSMPVIPIIDVGLSPILQMTIIPVTGLWLVNRLPKWIDQGDVNAR